MLICNGVAMLELKVNHIIFHPTLIWDDEAAILIDAGVPGQLEQIRTAMSEVGVPFSRLKAIILTHQDIDHIGSLPEIQQDLAHPIKVYAHKLDKPYIEGDLRLIKNDRSRLSVENWGKLPEIAKALYDIPNLPKAKVDQTIEDGDELPFFGGIQVIFTPGHTPGHISLYVRSSKTLVAGDAMFSVNGTLHGPHLETTLDTDMAQRSLEKYLNYDIDSVICYHGGLSTNNINDQLQNLVGEISQSRKKS